MLLSGLLSCLLLLQSTVAHPPLKDKRAFSTVDAFKTFEYPVALNGLFANIGPSGSKASGAAAGVVLASPSKCG
jgi:glucoamylase